MSKHKMLQIQSINKSMAFDKQRWRVFGTWLKSEREKANLSQDGLADLVGVDRQTIYRLENAISGTRRETVLALADALKIDHALGLKKAGFALQNDSDSDNDIVSWYEDIKKLSPKSQMIAKRQISTIINTLAEVDEEYIKSEHKEDTSAKHGDAITLEEAIADNKRKVKKPSTN